MLAAGHILDGRYEIVSIIASGGMGAVYRARRTMLLDEVAIKVILADSAIGSVRDRFMRESRASARLRHPNIVSILDFDVDSSGNPFLVMELLSGPSLKDEIAARRRLDVADVQRIVPQLCNALQLAHSNGIVHRDLKPANVVRHDFPGGEQVYKIVDFGIAAIRESSDETRLTGADQFLGTVAYPLVLAKMSKQTSILGPPAGERLVVPSVSSRSAACRWNSGWDTTWLSNALASFRMSSAPADRS